VPCHLRIQWLYEMFVRGAIWDGRAGLAWAHLRVELSKIIALKIKEMRIIGRTPRLPKAPHGDYDPRILASPLQRRVGTQALETPDESA